MSPNAIASRITSSRGIGRPALLGVLLLLGVAATLAWSTMSLQAHTCNVCMDYQGRSKCREVAATSIEEARTGAITNACAFVSSGMRDSMACQRTQPTTETCN